MTTEKNVPSLYEWAGGEKVFQQLTSTFYGKVLKDPLLEPLFGSMAQDHPQRVAWCLGEIFGGPHTYTEQLAATLI